MTLAALQGESGGARSPIRQSFLDRIHDGVDPFASYATTGTASAAASDALPDGWGSDHPYFKEYIDLIRPSRIVEVGNLAWRQRGAYGPPVARRRSE